MLRGPIGTRPIAAAGTKSSLPQQSEYEDRSLPVKGQVLFDKNTAHADSRVQIGYAYRILRSTIDCFQSEDGSERYIGTGVSGWLDLGDGWRHYLTLDKHLPVGLPGPEEQPPANDNVAGRPADLVFFRCGIGLFLFARRQGSDALRFLGARP